MTRHPAPPPARDTRLIFLNLGHAYDHLFMLLYPTVVLALERHWSRSYEELIWVATVGLVTYAGGTLPAGWLGDRFDRDRLLVVFFIGIGAASVFTGLAAGLAGLAVGLGLIGLFGAIYHPVGLALLVSGRDKVGQVLGRNGVWGNMGVAAAALVAGVLTDLIHWRAAFVVPGLVSIATGLAYLMLLRRRGRRSAAPARRLDARAAGVAPGGRVRAIAVVLAAASCGGLIFGGMTVILPKALQDGLAGSTAEVGGYAAAVFAAASFAQLLAGRLVDRREARWLLLGVAAGQAAFLAALAFGIGGPALPGAALGVMLFAFAQIPINDALVARYTVEHWRARIYSLKYMATFGVSIVTVPAIAWLRGLSGDFGLLYVAMVGLALAIAVVAWLLPLSTDSVRPATADAASGAVAVRRLRSQGGRHDASVRRDRETRAGGAAAL